MLTEITAAGLQLDTELPHRCERATAAAETLSQAAHCILQMHASRRQNENSFIPLCVGGQAARMMPLWTERQTILLQLALNTAAVSLQAKMQRRTTPQSQPTGRRELSYSLFACAILSLDCTFSICLSMDAVLRQFVHSVSAN